MSKLLLSGILKAGLACAMIIALSQGIESRAALTNENFDTPYDPGTLLPAFLPITTTTLDQWAAEGAMIATLGDGILPATGNQMVCLDDDGTFGSKIEMKQRIDVSLMSADIDAGVANFDYFADFNVPAAATNARAEIYVNFLDLVGALIAPTVILNTDDVGGLDADVTTWQCLTFTDEAVPVGTRFVEAYLQYDVASLGGTNAYVDKVHLELGAIPEPATVALAAVALLAGAIRRRK